MNASNLTSFRRLAMGASLAVLTTALSAAPASAAGKVPYSGTGKADKIDFRNSYKAYDIKGLGGNDLIYTNGYDDVVDGGKDNDTIDPGSGNDTVRGGPGKDYFRQQFHSEDGEPQGTGSDAICDFKGDKLDVYFFGEYVGFDEDDEVVISYSVNGGNYKLFDTNKDGVINNADSTANVKSVKACGGSSKPSLQLDVAKAFTGSSTDSNDHPMVLTIYGVASLKKSDFVVDYHRDKPY